MYIFSIKKQGINEIIYISWIIVWFSLFRVSLWIDNIYTMMTDAQIFRRKVTKNSLWFWTWNSTKVIWAQVSQTKVQILQVFYSRRVNPYGESLFSFSSMISQDQNLPFFCGYAVLVITWNTGILYINHIKTVVAFTQLHQMW